MNSTPSSPLPEFSRAHCPLVTKCTAPAVALLSGADIVVWCEAGHVSIMSPNIPDTIRQVYDFSRGET